jgi:hypothetical protein
MRMHAMRRSLVSRSRSPRVMAGRVGATPVVMALGAVEGRTGVVVWAMVVSSVSQMFSTTHYLC